MFTVGAGLTTTAAWHAGKEAARRRDNGRRGKWTGEKKAHQQTPANNGILIDTSCMVRFHDLITVISCTERAITLGHFVGRQRAQNSSVFGRTVRACIRLAPRSSAFVPFCFWEAAVCRPSRSPGRLEVYGIPFRAHLDAALAVDARIGILVLIR